MRLNRSWRNTTRRVRPHSRLTPRDSVETIVIVTLEADSVIEAVVTTADTAAVAMTIAVAEAVTTVIVTADILEVGMIDAVAVAIKTDAVTMEAARMAAPEVAAAATEIVTVTTAVVADETVAGQAVVAAVVAVVVAVGRAVAVAMEAPSRAAGREDTDLDSSSGELVERPGTEADLPGRDRAAGRSRVISSRSKPLGDSGQRVMDKHSRDSTRATATHSGTQPQLPRRGQPTASRAARTGATPAASIRSNGSGDADWLPTYLWAVHGSLTQDSCRPRVVSCH